MLNASDTAFLLNVPVLAGWDVFEMPEEVVFYPELNSDFDDLACRLDENELACFIRKDEIQSLSDLLMKLRQELVEFKQTMCIAHLNTLHSETEKQAIEELAFFYAERLALIEHLAFHFANRDLPKREEPNRICFSISNPKDDDTFRAILNKNRELSSCAIPKFVNTGRFSYDIRALVMPEARRVLGILRSTDCDFRVDLH